MRKELSAIITKMSFKLPVASPSNSPVVKKEECSPRIYPRIHDRSDLLKWPILGMLSTEFLANIRMAFVYGFEALIVSKKDKVYAVGKNSLGCLEGAKSGEDSLFHPREVQELSGKNIKTFRFCKDSTVVALGHDGTIYYTEGVGFIELNMEDSTNMFNQKINVCSISCQQNQIFVLLEDGQVFIWKKDMSSVALTQRKIFSYIHKSKTIYIECTHSACVAVTTEGDLYVWNNSHSPRFGNRTSVFGEVAGSSVDEPFKKINLPNDVKIEKVACGYEHILALSQSGHVYAWGSNCAGQLGYIPAFGVIPTKDDSTIYTVPQQVLIPTMGRVVDIAATNHCNISVAATSCGQIFMWGDCGGVIVRSPIVTPYSSIYEILEKFARIKLMHKPLIIDVNQENSNILQTFESAFDDPETSDFTIEVEGKPIYVHKAILKITSEYYRKMFRTDWAENKADVMEHKEFSYDVYKAFLRYLYTGKVGLLPRDALELFRLASQYLDNRLQKLCEENIVNGLRVSNALLVFVTARQHVIEDLEYISLNFIMSNFTAVVQTDEFLCLDGDIAKELVRTAAGKGIFKK